MLRPHQDRLRQMLFPQLQQLDRPLLHHEQIEQGLL